MPMRETLTDKILKVYQFQAPMRMGNMRNVDLDGGSV